MKWLKKLQRKMRNFGIPNLMLYITATMLFFFLADLILPLTPNFLYWMDFSRGLILQGEVWRLLTFLFMPPATNIIWLFFSLLFNVYVGRSLENHWGASSFTFYYLWGVIGLLVGGFITGSTTNIYLNTSLFLAFAQLYPDQEIRVMFLIHVKAKYLGYAQWIVYGILLIINLQFQNWGGAVALVMSVLNFIIFFGPGMIDRWRTNYHYRKRRKEFKEHIKNNQDRF